MDAYAILSDGLDFVYRVSPYHSINVLQNRAVYIDPISRMIMFGITRMSILTIQTDDGQNQIVII